MATSSDSNSQQGSQSNVSSASVDKVVEALLQVLQLATSPEAIQTQQILLGRLARSGDVIPSRVKAPKNITEIGGYINLLRSAEMKEILDDPNDIATQTVSSILGVAGPTVPLPAGSTMCTLVARTNDRPGGDSLQASIPNSYYLRSDFASAFDAAMREIHDVGARVAWIGAPRYLPDANTPFNRDRVLPYLGRQVAIVSATALTDVSSDPIIIGRVPAAQGADPHQPFFLASRVTQRPSPGVAPENPADWQLLRPIAGGGYNLFDLPQPVAFLPLDAPDGALTKAGWYPSEFAVGYNPLSITPHWNRWTNIQGLVGGTTTLGQELALLYTKREIGSSSFADHVNDVWNDRTRQFEASA